MQKLSLISVEPEPLPAFEEVMTVLEAFVCLLYESLEKAGATVCRRYDEELGGREVPEPYLLRNDGAGAGEAILGPERASG